MKRYSLFVFLGLFLLPLIPCMHAGAAELKIGMVDTQKILRESKAAKKARDILMKDLAAKNAQIKAEEDQTRKLGEEIKKDGPSMSPEIRKEKTEKLEKEVKELGRLKSDLEEELRKKDTELARELLREVYDIVKDYSKKEKFTVILDRRSVVTADDAIDITDKIIRLYDSVK